MLRNLQFYHHVPSNAFVFCMKMLLVLTIALFVGLATSRPSDNAIGKNRKKIKIYSSRETRNGSLYAIKSRRKTEQKLAEKKRFTMMVIVDANN